MGDDFNLVTGGIMKAAGVSPSMSSFEAPTSDDFDTGMMSLSNSMLKAKDQGSILDTHTTMLNGGAAGESSILSTARKMLENAKSTNISGKSHNKK